MHRGRHEAERVRRLAGFVVLDRANERVVVALGQVVIVTVECETPQPPAATLPSSSRKMSSSGKYS